MLGQFPWAPWAGVPELPDGAVVDELPLSVVVDDPELEDELEPSLVCAWATIAPPPTIAPASASDNTPLRIHLCMCITSSRRSWYSSRNTPRAERLLKSRKSRVRICASHLMLSARTGTDCDGRTMRSRFRRSRCILLASLSVIALSFAPTRASAATARVSIGAGLRGPDGLAASVFAKGLRYAAALTSDSEGRLWIATAAATDKGTDAIYLVPSTGATPVKIVTDVHTPLGIVWVGDTLYVSQHGGVLALGGFDGSSFSTRSTIVSFADGTGELNGITLGTDGRLYVGISAPCDSCTPDDAYSASIVSFLPDGSDLQVYASDLRAPIGLAFFPDTSDLFVTMNQRDDLGKKTPGDWLALVRAGDSWGFPSCYGQRTTKCSATPSPVAELDTHAAVSGVAVVTGQLGATVGTSAVVAEWMTGKVRLVHLTRSGTGYVGKTGTLLTGLKNPVGVTLDAGGALYVSDWTTGKIYRITA
jgi:glucose/arabinose dehydrogenase